jgi:hypothetical protein
MQIHMIVPPPPPKCVIRLENWKGMNNSIIKLPQVVQYFDICESQ